MEIRQFRKLSRKNQICRIGLLDHENIKPFHPIFFELLKSSESAPDLIVAIYRALLRNRAPEFIHQAKKHFGDPNHMIATAAIEYAGELSPDWFVRVSGKLLQGKNLAIYRAAVKTLNRLSPDAAVSAIRAMVASNRMEQILSAIYCMIFVDFHLVRTMAANIATTTSNEEIFAAIILLFQNNPETENLEELFRIEKLQNNASWANLAAKTRIENEKMLREMGHISSYSFIATECYLEQKLENEDSAKRTYKTNFFKAQTNTLEKISDSLKEAVAILSQWKNNLLTRTVAITFFLLVAFSFFFSEHKQISDPSTVSSSILYNPRSEIAKIEQFDHSFAIIRLSDNSKIRIRPQNGSFAQTLPARTLVRADFIPFRQLQSGEILAICTNLIKITQ